MSSTLSPDIQSLFESALSEYEKRTGTNLTDNELSSRLRSCDSADSVIAVLQDQTQAFRKYRGDRGRVMIRLNQAVNALYTLSTSPVLVGGIGIPFPPATAIFAGIGTLLSAIKDVSASYDALVELFELIENFLRRLDIYTKVESTTAMTEIVVKILVELLATLALATQQVTQGRLIKFGRKLLGERDVEDLLQKLDRLTQEESRTTAAVTLEVIHGLAKNLREVMDNEKVSADYIRRVFSSLQDLVSNEIKRNRDRSREKSRKWLSPPDPSLNQNVACETYHDGTATWFVQGATFLEWKARGSLLWIHGKPGSGKSVLCSTIVRVIESMQETATASTAFFYFDFRDDEKRNRRGLLASLLVQFCAQSDDCCDILSRLYSVNGDGLRQPSDRALLDCLKEMLTVGKLGPTYIVVDALDECPIITGTPSAREKVLDLVINLVDLNNPNLRLCVTSRPEAGIWTALLPLASHSVSLHEEVGQMVDINNYISFFVTSDKTMSQWREQDRSLVINKLRQEAAGMFRWVFCQLDKLRRCFPGRIRGALDELPRTLDATYERTLQDIDEEKRGYAHRLLQCIAVASRPLRVDELAEFLAVDFDAGGTPTLVVDWRPENPGNAVLSTCSSLIAVVTVDGSPVVQFSHFSVQEFLMSSRLATGCVSHYYISLEPAHTIVAQACLSVLLQLGNHINKRSIEKYPLAHYAAQHWVDHAKFQNVSSRAEDSMKRLFDRDRPHFAAWVWIHDMDREWRGSIASETPLQPDAPPIYYATLLGLPGIAEWLATARSQDVNKKGGYYGTPLCAAAARGHLEVAQVLVKCDAHVDAAGRNGWSPLLWASEIGCLELSRLMLDLGADINFRDSSSRTPLSLASDKDHQEITTLLLQRGADANIWEQGKGTILIKALQREDLVFARRLLMNYGADVNARNDDGLSLLHLATGHNNLGSVRWLFKHGANFPRNIQWAPFPKGDRRITGAFPGSFYSPFDSFWSPRIIDLAKPVYLPDVEGKTQAASEGPATKRRALIVGISYFYSQPDAWWPLGGPHECVDRFRDLLIGTYGYTPDDITVLKDGPKFPDRLQPTRANMISELKKLVGDAAPGDRFTFFYIGLTGHLRSHSDDENGVIVTCDLERIFDYELNDILTLLPVGCFLLAVFDACHTGTMLDLPHSHCNNIYVPWLSKGERHTPTMPYQDVRNHPIDLPSIANVMAIDNNIRSHTYPQSSLGARLQIDTQVGGTDEWQLNRDSEAYQTHRSALLPVPPTLCESPVPMFECDGWCDYDFHSYPIVLSLSASSDPQRAWEGPRGSLTTVLCKYLETQPRPSYRDLLSHINFALHENSHELYKHIREQRKAVLRNGSDFDGEMVNFQGPLLSSLAKLDLDDIFQL